MMKLAGEVHCTNILAEFEFGVIALPPRSAPPKMWHWATTSGKSAQAVKLSLKLQAHYIRDRCWDVRKHDDRKHEGLPLDDRDVSDGLMTVGHNS